MGPHLFVCTVWRERRACPLEELKGCPRWTWAFCRYWVRFSGGVLIHILNMQSCNKAKGSDNTPRTREDIVKPRPSHQQGSPLHTLCGQNKTRLCWRSDVTTAIITIAKNPCDCPFPLKTECLCVFTPTTTTEACGICIENGNIYVDHLILLRVSG